MPKGKAPEARRGVYLCEVAVVSAICDAPEDQENLLHLLAAPRLGNYSKEGSEWTSNAVNAIFEWTAGYTQQPINLHGEIAADNLQASRRLAAAMDSSTINCWSLCPAPAVCL